jgi:hypothetical protein
VVGSPKSFVSVPRHSWIDRKKKFEVEFYGTPLGFEVTLQHLPGVVRTLSRRHSLVISVSSVEEARRLCLEGVSHGQNLFCATPFVFVPQIASRDYGSLSHKKCGKRLCFHCGELGMRLVLVLKSCWLIDVCAVMTLIGQESVLLLLQR